MIENYNDVMAQWAAPSQGCCTDMMTVNRDADLYRWSVTRTVTVLANSDYYYTKDEVNNLLSRITSSGVTRSEVEQMINEAIRDKADKSEVVALSQQVAANTQAILNRYTKQEVNTLLDSYLTKVKGNEMFANYSKVEDTTLHLNAEDIGI